MYAVCVFSDSPVGADLQKMKNILPKHLNKILSAEEQQYLKTLPKSDQTEIFNKISYR
jgi:phosphopantetheinyl transferase